MILPSAQKPNHKEMQVIHLDQDMQVCGIFYIVPILYIFGTPYIMTLSLYLDECLYFKVWAIFIFLPFFFSFLHALWHVFFLSGLLAWIYCFSIAHIFLFGI
jgi:hypothetical protein